MAGRESVLKKPKDTAGTLRRCLRYLAAYNWAILAVLLFSAVSNVLALLGPSFAGSAINAAAAGKGLVDMDRVYYYVIRMLAVYLASSAMTISISCVMTMVSKRIARRMRADVFAKLMRLPVGFFDRNSSGDIISRVSYDIDVVSSCLATDVTQIVTSIVSVAGALVMMVILSPVLSLVVLVTIPISVVYTAWMRRQVQPRYSRRSRSYGTLNGFAEEMLTGQKTIQAYAYGSSVNRRFDAVNDDARDAFYSAEFLGCTIGPTMNLINNIGLSLIALFGSLLYMGGGVSLGQISSFVLYSRKFSGPINEIANIINELFSALSAAERVFRLLDEPEEPADADGAQELTRAEGQVTLSHVSFGYLPGRTILKDLSLHAEPGMVIAIVGPTGAGKTTIINLLMRFYDIDAGSIRMDGRDVDTLTRSSVRKAYAMVLQDTWVFGGTIFENIAYGRQDASREEVIAAAKAARIHSFIMQLPQGYDTVISEDGSNISKGQKQLLTIARAMLYDAGMLILDEATSNVDTGTEREVQKAMRSLMAGKTCFVIAHRLSTIQNADRILVIENGDVVEQGTHDSLMAAGGAYSRLYNAQFS